MVLGVLQEARVDLRRLGGGRNGLIRGRLVSGSFATAVRSSGFRASSELGPPDFAAMNLLYELGEIAAAGGDIRRYLFG